MIYINKHRSDFVVSRGFYFCETSHRRSFANIKPSRKYLNLQYRTNQEANTNTLIKLRKCAKAGFLATRTRYHDPAGENFKLRPDFFTSWFTNPPTVIFRKIVKKNKIIFFILSADSKCYLFRWKKYCIFEVLSVYFWEWHCKWWHS